MTNAVHVHAFEVTHEIDAEICSDSTTGLDGFIDAPSSEYWKTYNFEVEEHHTYVADGVRVHNTSGDFYKAEDGSVLWDDHRTVGYMDGIQLEGLTGGNNSILDSVLPRSVGGYYSPSMTEYTNVMSNGFAQTVNLAQFQSTAAQVTGGWTPPPGTHVVPRGGGFEIRYDDGSDWSGSEDGTSIPKDDGGHNHDPSTGKFSRSKPILLDLDGTGLSVIELDSSTTYVDSTNDGLLHRTAWAGTGDGVLFFDTDNSGDISSTREYVFTEWDPTAATDLEALASVFDTNGDGILSGASLTASWSWSRRPTASWPQGPLPSLTSLVDRIASSKPR